MCKREGWVKVLTKPVLKTALFELSSRSVARIGGGRRVELIDKLVLSMNESGSQDVLAKTIQLPNFLDFGSVEKIQDIAPVSKIPEPRVVVAPGEPLIAPDADLETKLVMKRVAEHLILVKEVADKVP